MAEGADLLLGFAGLPAGVAVWELGKWLIVGRLKRAEKTDEKLDAEKEQKLDALLQQGRELGVLVQRIDRDLALLTQSVSVHTGTVAEVKARVDGMSQNYGQRVAKLEQDLVELRTLLSARRRNK